MLDCQAVLERDNRYSRGVGSQATYAIPIICLLVQNCINIALKGA